MKRFKSLVIAMVVFMAHGCLDANEQGSKVGYWEYSGADMYAMIDIFTKYDDEEDIRREFMNTFPDYAKIDRHSYDVFLNPYILNPNAAGVSFKFPLTVELADAIRSMRGVNHFNIVDRHEGNIAKSDLFTWKEMAEELSKTIKIYNKQKRK